MQNETIMFPANMVCSKHDAEIIHNCGNKRLVCYLAIFDTFIQEPTIMALAGRNDTTGQLAEVSGLSKLSEKHSPLCCYFGERLQDIIYRVNSGRFQEEIEQRKLKAAQVEGRSSDINENERATNMSEDKVDQERPAGQDAATERTEPGVDRADDRNEPAPSGSEAQQ